MMLLAGTVASCGKKDRTNPLDPTGGGTGSDPFGLTAKLGNGGIVLTWHAVGVRGVEKYLVERGKVGDSGEMKEICEMAAGPREFSFLVLPNPIRDVHTATFVVRGTEADLIRVEVYDLSGRLVWQGEAPGSRLVWHTEDLVGNYLANGVYLYVIRVKVGDSWIHSGIQKLAIYR